MLYISRTIMGEPHNVTSFGYRAPRVAFPGSLQVELARAGAKQAIWVRGIDISATGIAIEVNQSIPSDEVVELVIQSGEDELARIPGRIFYQSDDRYGLAFEFSSEEQVQKAQNLISGLVRTMEYVGEPEHHCVRHSDPGDLDRIHGRPKM
jgi:hypothetical protein